ncbi:geranylgeranylglyceryl/heptaprenylglyceryl phosphate synthase [Carboxylicivirga mesophila]|uniref:Geranylgeranylglyceryl phosphate synthase n=1 Tax=Carboxylicivirga mesophila TaxID=1166478 RepID=A0ABS5K6D7_9BACT|nr:geranylgeranylglyceryl/heptaprenylglyceryl phosphate synthase [Carboxylicivirga mesophila]MBS2210553.1 geranylgeranylglyceryl/heptaprenylglyceryl phosphate synthase [Carboxylicivirga mesophila]
MIYKQLEEKYDKGKKQLAFLIDPDKFSFDKMAALNEILASSKPDLLLVGGSLISNDTSAFVKELKKHVSQPVVLYPGSSIQLCSEVDAVLFLSLISGRNPEFLISHHVAAAPHIKANDIEAIPTGYMLIDGGSNTSVQYISQTLPIPSEKLDIAVATALAGQYLGMKMIYMDAGSGAVQPISQAIINAVQAAVDIPLMIGGGIRSVDDLSRAYEAGADLVVVGNVLEQDLSLLNDFHKVVERFNK